MTATTNQPGLFYRRFISLCERNKVSPSRAAIDAGVSKSLVSKWKNNSSAVPSADVLTKLSDYFGVPVDHLLGREYTNQPRELNLTDEWEGVVNSRCHQLQLGAETAVRRIRARRGIRLALTALLFAALAAGIFATVPELAPAAYALVCAACFQLGRFTEFCTRRYRK